MPLKRSNCARILVFLVLTLAGATAFGESPADRLLKLVSADAGATLAVENLREHARAFFNSPVSDGLLKLPAARHWSDAPAFRNLRKTVEQLEHVLGVKAETLRDDLLGDAFVLSIRLPPGGRPDEARGLLLLRSRSRDLLARLSEELKVAPRDGGDVQRVVEKKLGRGSCFIREFAPGKKANEYFTLLAEDIFAWSNSEELIGGAIDRNATGQESLFNDPAFQKVRLSFGTGGVASLFVNPRFLERLLAAAPPSEKPQDARVSRLLSQYLAAVKYAGASLDWREGLAIRTEEVIDPAKLDPALRKWAEHRETPANALWRVPPTALMTATASLDAEVLMGLLLQLVHDGDRPRIDNLLLAIQGFFLGLDVNNTLIPNLGPGISVYVERPDPEEPDEKRLPAVLAIELDRKGGIGAERLGPAFDNALRTLLALYILDAKNQAGGSKVESQTVEGTPVTALNKSTPFAYAIREGRLYLGTTLRAVSRALTAQGSPQAGERLEKIRAECFPGTVSSAVADLRRIHEFVTQRRDFLSRRLADRQGREEEDVAHDLDQVEAITDLFDVAYLSSKISPDFSEIQRSLGLVRLRLDRP